MSYQQSPLVDAYIAQFDETTRQRLTSLRQAIQATFPGSIEDVSYGMPTYRSAPKKRGFVYFGAAKAHVALYGILEPKSNAPMQKKMHNYRTGKGTLQFKHTDPLPINTIRQILAYQATQIEQM